MVDAIPALTTEKAVKLFETFHVFTRAELESRAEVEYDSYSKIINIEAMAMVNIASKQIIPAVIRYASSLADSMGKIVSACPEADVSVQKELLLETSDLLSDMKVALGELNDACEKCREIEGSREKANAFRKEVVPLMEKLRTPADALEKIVDKSMWPLPSYGDLLFEV